MTRTFLLCLASVAAAAAASGVAAAQSVEPGPPTPREALEWMVLTEINSAYFDRAEAMNRPALVERVPDGVIKTVDISHDGVEDWLVDYTESGLMYCGTGGCLRTLYVSGPDGLHVMAFNDQSYDFVIRRRNDETVIDMAVHQVMCQPAHDECAYSFAWDARLQRLVERPNVRGETLLSSSFAVLAPPEQDQPRPPEGAPEPLQARWRATAVACPSASSEGEFHVRHATIYSLPDLNGDDRRDWYYEAPYGCPETAEAQVDPQPFQIWFDQPDRDAELGFTSSPGERPIFDIAATPARLISNPECGFDQPCRNQRLAWEASTRRFLPIR